MMNWFDLAVLVFLAWGGERGYYRGFYASAFNFLGWTAALITAFLFKSSFSYFVEAQYNITPKIAAAISKNIDLPVKVTGGYFSGEDPLSFIQGISLPENIKTGILEYFNQGGERLLEQGGTVVDLIYAWLAEVIVSISCFFIIFLVIGSLFKLGEGVIQLKMDVREKGNLWLKSVSGLLIGVIKNLLVVIAIIHLASPLLELLNFLFVADIKESFTVSSISSVHVLFSDLTSLFIKF